MKTKIFCDIADLKTIRLFNKKPIVDGFTTNPSLMRLAGANNYKDYSRKILKVCKKKPISFEVFADNSKDMLKQAYKINSWGKNIYVKIPLTNSKGVFTGSVIKELSDKGIKLNITAVYTYEQTKMILKKLNKNKINCLYFCRSYGRQRERPFQYLKKAYLLQKNIKILKSYGQVLEKHIIIFKRNN